jgi:hypothetical protein
MKRTGMWPLTAAFLGLAVAIRLPASAEDGGSMVVSHPMIGEAAPAFDLEEVSGGALSLDALKGQYIVLHFGASW